MKIIAKTSLSVVLIGSALLSGCASLGYGEPDYSCSGIPNGLKCMSATEVYEMTNSGNPIYEGLGGELVVNEEVATYVDSQESPKTKAVSIEAKRLEEQIAMYGSPARVPVPNVNTDPIPVRTPAVVMKIWVAPWEDGNGDLITSGYVHTEVEPRRWQVGLPTSRTTTTLRPLQSYSGAKKD
tara:strand:+ start:770 stop:1315 length:546 start_codon:yes stop_codon:yes gene_type:complete